MKNISHRIVHFDLKGAPWKVPYLKEVILVAKQWGATGILFEWEDTFPYTGNLIMIGSLGGSNREGLYSDEDIKQLLQFTVDNGMEPIQLVQTLGHLEYVLKHHEFAHLRELRFYPSVLCPTRPGGKELVVAMIKQALNKQPDAKFIHIGADEAWHINKCDECTTKTSNVNFGVDSLFILHIRNIVTEIQLFFPNIKILIWDDMMRSMQEESLIAGEMSKLVIPVVWHYSPVGSFALDWQMWLKYEKCFFEVWVASAFKGANGSSQMLSSVEHYVSNQEAWLQQLRRLEGRRLLVTGLVLTGWSRFDHYATLCELLPVSLPSLTSCLRVWTKSNDTYSGSVSCAWSAGCALARAVRECGACLARSRGFISGDAVSTWMNPWQLEHNYTTAMQLIPIASAAKMLIQELNVVQAEVSVHLNSLTGPRSAEEWVHSNIEPAASELRRLASLAAERSQRCVPVTPTVINRGDTES